MKIIYANITKKREVSKKLAESIFQESLEVLFNIIILPKESKLHYEIEKIEGSIVSVKFYWTKDFQNYNYSCDYLEEVIDCYSTLYNFNKPYDSIIDEIVEDLERSANYAAYSKDELIKKINFTDTYFNKYNIKVLYLGQTDIYPIDYPTYYYLKTTYGNEYRNDIKNNENLIEINNFLKHYCGNKYIDLINYKINKISPNYIPYMYDTNHLTNYGTEQYKHPIKNRILEVIN